MDHKLSLMNEWNIKVVENVCMCDLNNLIINLRKFFRSFVRCHFWKR